MTNSDIIKWAREAGCSEPVHPMNDWHVSQEALERFTALVRADRKEACAKVAEEFYYLGPASAEIADAIRTMDEPDDL